MKSFMRFGLPRSLQSDNGTSFTSKSPKGSLKHWALLIISIVPGGLSLQKKQKEPKKISDKKVINITDILISLILKSVIKKTTQETSLGWKNVLPIALLHTHIAPKEQVGLSPYEMLYGRPLFMSMTSSLIQRLSPSSLIPWPLGNSDRIYACGVSTRTQKILKSHHYILLGLKC